ncbi:Ppx/GppA phosphatase family protein [Paenibacillus xylaniclasticus]|uniref:Ppx/GppA phosphatase family protein n=1 Tax=Paenibacillus xylaniclasticus TaxID=588083 RepID=UPI000FDA45DF|nr:MULTISPECIES: Ppx/GppA phosphatase family protein [Paenibacillus]GFN33824.1 exopolyphosphatase [Paenibacillus curdlanolyticus]
MIEQRIGIIDIGSNSIRLAVYERTASGAHRVIDGSKRPARLSGAIDEQGRLMPEKIDELISILNHYRLICTHHRTGYIRTVATAAIRNAVNRDEIAARLQQETGMTIEIISGEEEARFGFLGMINSMDIRDGFLIDIGGGSTEISLFRDRTLVQSVSFPFGCVNMSRSFLAEDGTLSDTQLHALEESVNTALEREPWLQWSPGLPLVGVGGTVRALGKLDQAISKYSFPLNHNYKISDERTDKLFEQLRFVPTEKRSKMPGLSKDRADVFITGLAILRVIYRKLRATHYLVCGAGLRDGLFYDTRFPNNPRLDDVLGYSIRNLCALHPEAPPIHVVQVNRLAMQLFETLNHHFELPERAALWLDAASTLFRIGASIDYYQYSKHTYYLIINSQLSGLSHREIIMIAAIASFKSKSKLRQQLAEFRDLLSEGDIDTAALLGMLLQLSIALDRSETQSIGRLSIAVVDGMLKLHILTSSGPLDIERAEVEELSKDFRKAWRLLPVLETPVP